MIKTIRMKRATAAQWTSSNPILDQGEIGLEYDTNWFKMGDGVSTWGALPYFKPASGYIPVLPDDPDPEEEPEVTGSMIEAFRNAPWQTDQTFYSTSDSAGTTTALTQKARDFLAALTADAQQGVMETYSMAEINQLFANAVPEALMGYSALNSNFSTSNQSVNPPSTAVIPMAVSVIGENRHVWVEFDGMVSVSGANAYVRFWLRTNGSYATTAVVAVPTAATYPAPIRIKRKLYLSSGQSYTFDVGVEVKSSGNTATVLGDPNMGAWIAVTRT